MKKTIKELRKLLNNTKVYVGDNSIKEIHEKLFTLQYTWVYRTIENGIFKDARNKYIFIRNNGLTTTWKEKEFNESSLKEITPDFILSLKLNS